MRDSEILLFATLVDHFHTVRIQAYAYKNKRKRMLLLTKCVVDIDEILDAIDRFKNSTDINKALHSKIRSMWTERKEQLLSEIDYNV